MSNKMQMSERHDNETLFIGDRAACVLHGVDIRDGRSRIVITGCGSRKVCSFFEYIHRYVNVLYCLLCLDLTGLSLRNR